MRKERKEVNISLLKTPELNTRIHPEKQIEEIRRSLKKWGQYKNIVIDDQNLVLAGNGLVEAMRLEGFKKAWAVILYELSENEKKKLMMADNKTTGLGIDNLGNIEALINELAGDFDIPGFDDEILKSINAASADISAALDEYGKASEENLKEIDAHADANAGDGDEATETKRESVTCPKCGEVIWL
jgi:hypothetical protein